VPGEQGQSAGGPHAVLEEVVVLAGLQGDAKPAGSGVKVPLSVTFANRSEAVKESFVRANFGVTLDLDTLLAK
jgi:hypothetical protein